MMTSIPKPSTCIEKPSIGYGELVSSSNEETMYKVTDTLGEGRCCVVYLVINSQKNEKLALKVFRPGNNYEGALQREQYILENLAAEGTNIVKYYEYFKYNDLHCMVQELLDCNIRQLIFKNGRKGFSFWGIQKFIKDALNGLKVLHDEGFVHADLKPPNIMWSSRDGCYKLLDFGLSFHVTEENLHQVQSTGYQAPETKLWNNYKEEQKFKKKIRKRRDSCPHQGYFVDDASIANGKLKLRKTENTKSPIISDMQIMIDTCQLCLEEKKTPPDQPGKPIDMWSLGCLFMEVMTGRKLLKNGDDDCTVQDKVQFLLQSKFDEHLKDNKIDSSKYYELVIDLIEKCLQVNAGDRLKCSEALMHPFLSLTFQPSVNDLLFLPTPILRLVDVISSNSAQDEIGALRKDILKECCHFGAVLHCHLQTSGPGKGNAYIQYYHSQSCMRALLSLSGKNINGKNIVASYFPLELWAQNDLF